MHLTSHLYFRAKQFVFLFSSLMIGLSWLPAQSIETPKKPMVFKAIEGSADIGKALFTGEKSFANGATPCIACHTTSELGYLAGGTLGPDLTMAYSKFGADIGLKSIIVSSPFTSMVVMYSKKPVEMDEAAHLTAYFAKTVSLEKKPSMDFTFSLISAGGFLFLYILIHFIWRKRLTGVHIPLVGR